MSEFTLDGQVQHEWVDYNGHMRDAYYGLSFSYAVDEVMIALGILVYLMFDDRSLAAGLEINGVGGMVALALGGSIRSALLWAPLLALHWFYAAQRVERLRGEDKVRDGV